MPGSQSRKRVAFVAAAVVVGALMVPSLFMVLWVVSLGVVALGIYELHIMGGQKGVQASLPMSLLAAAAIMAAALLPPARFLQLMPFIVSALTILGFIAHIVFRGTGNALLGVPLTLFAPVYVALPIAMAFQIISDAKVDGRVLVLAILIMIWATDIAAYYTGRSLGRHKLAPDISPKKTWEGAIGGAVASIIVVVIMSLVLPAGRFPFTVLESAALGLLITVLAQAGDLAESCIKRDAGVKDSGTIMAGHGGILDRIDSLLFAMPGAYAYLAFTERLRGVYDMM